MLHPKKGRASARFQEFQKAGRALASCDGGWGLTADVLAGRKTVGKIEGTIAYGGHRPTKSFLRRYTGYVEQFGKRPSLFTGKYRPLREGCIPTKVFRWMAACAPHLCRSFVAPGRGGSAFS